jgi:alkanesulfonate monooxygenase SsuD/methylene tetrahydromethanopterin reductase-like flavin-dependent oxidoreductase (luciferase family)
MEIFGFGVSGEIPGQPHTQALHDLFDVVREADRLGIDGWFFTEHHGNSQFSITPAPNLLIAALAQTTSRIRLGNMVTVLPFHHPLRVAEETRTLDLLSGGRLEMGFGRGHLPLEQRAFGVDREQTVEMFDAALDIVQRLLGGETVDYHTPWWNGDGASAVPEPVRQEIPLWITCSSIDRCAMRGANCATALLTRNAADERLAEYRASWDRHHPDRLGEGKFSVSATVAVADTEAEAVRQVKSELAKHQAVYGQAVAAPDGPLTGSYAAHRATYEQFVGATYDRLVDDGLLIVGTVEQCREQMVRLRDRGFDRVLCVFQSDETGYEFALESMRRFATEVVPYVRAQAPASAEAERPSVISTGAGRF